jgi:hypothetical protein
MAAVLAAVEAGVAAQAAAAAERAGWEADMAAYAHVGGGAGGVLADSGGCGG